MPYPPKYTLNESFFNKLDAPSSAYWAGVISADGYINRMKPNKLRLSIDLSVKDEEWLALFRKDIGSNHPFFYCKSFYKDAPTVRIDITRYSFVLPLVEQHVKTSRVFEFVPKNMLHHFIRGVVDGDGCFSVNTFRCKLGYSHRTASFCVVNENKLFLEILQSVLIEFCGINKTKLLQNKSVWQLKVAGGNQVNMIGEFLYPSEGKHYPCLERKRNAFIECTKNSRLTIKREGRKTGEARVLSVLR